MPLLTVGTFKIGAMITANYFLLSETWIGQIENMVKSI